MPFPSSRIPDSGDVAVLIRASAQAPECAEHVTVIHKPLSKAAWAVRLFFVLAVVAGAAGAFSLAHNASGAPSRAAVAVAAPSVHTAVVLKGTLLGTAGNDALTAGTSSTVIRAGNGSDAISASNGVRDYIDCGGGLDSVTADRVDELRNCEFVVRVES